MAAIDIDDPTDWSQIVRKIDPKGLFLHAHRYLDGQSAVTTRLTWADSQQKKQTAVVRQLRSGKSAAQEFRTLHAVHQMGLKTPAPYLIDETRSILTTPYLVMSHVTGRPDYQPQNRSQMAQQIATELAQLHQLPQTAADWTFLPLTADWVRNQINQSFNKPSMHPLESLALNTIQADKRPWQNHNTPRLLHGDFWPGNWLWSNGHLQAIIDWEDALWGDPLADLAIAQLDISLIFGEPAAQVFTATYMNHISKNIDFQYLPFWRLASALRAYAGTSAWSQGWPVLGRPDITYSTMINRLNRFTKQTLSEHT